MQNTVFYIGTEIRGFFNHNPSPTYKAINYSTARPKYVELNTKTHYKKDKHYPIKYKNIINN